MRADLHLHSVWSDGALSPEELARRAKGAGVELFSVTDHDNMGGSEEGRLAAIACGLHYVRGWEISAYEGACKVHILGYGCRADGAYLAFLEERAEGARVRAASVLARANAFFGLDVTMDDVEAYHVRKSAPLHTMHVVSAFARRLGREKGELYRAAFARGGAAFSEECRPTPQDAIRVIHETGGIAVLAHPGRIVCLGDEEQKIYRLEEGARPALKRKNGRLREELFSRLAEEGLDGIECLYTTHTVTETERFCAFARSRGLWITGGSDFHAVGGENEIGRPRFFADDALTELLLSFRGSV